MTSGGNTTGSMRKKQHQLFSKILCVLGLFFVLFGASVTNFVLAQGGGADSGQAANPTPPPAGGTNVNTSGSSNTQGGVDGGLYAGAENQVAKENAAVAQQLGQIDDPILRLLHAIVVQGLGSLVGWFGSAFDWAIENMIIGFGDQYLNYNIGYTVEQLWSTVRDIFNLTFIFGLVYIGFKMILDSSDHHARQMLVSLVGAALLVNFSLFITKFVVDFSNIAAYQIYQAFETKEAGDALSITSGFMNTMGINSILSPAYGTSNSLGYNYIFGLTVVFLVLAYVFLMGAIMIIIRFAVLSIYLVFSPMMFLGWVFPSMQHRSSEYWKGFLNQAFFAPAFLFMLYLSYRVATDYKFNQQELGHMFKNDGSIVEIVTIIPYFAMVVVFLIASMVVAKSMGATGANMAVSVGHNLKGRAYRAMGGATFGMGARLGRTAVGGTTKAVLNTDWAKRNAVRFGRVGKGVYMAADKHIADNSFDARKIGGMGKALEIGEGKKGGYNSRLKETKESDSKFLEAIGTRDGDTDPMIKIGKANLEGLKKRLEFLDKKDPEYKSVQSAIEAAEKYVAEREYANQIAYIQALEKWDKVQKLMLNSGAALGAGIGITLLTGGLAAGAATTVTYAAAGKGIKNHSKSDLKALLKEYGKDGLAKTKSKAKKEALGDLAKAVKEEAGEHKDAHHGDKPAASKPSAPAAKATGGGGHDHGHH